MLCVKLCCLERNGPQRLLQCSFLTLKIAFSRLPFPTKRSFTLPIPHMKNKMCSLVFPLNLRLYLGCWNRQVSDKLKTGVQAQESITRMSSVWRPKPPRYFWQLAVKSYSLNALCSKRLTGIEVCTANTGKYYAYTKQLKILQIASHAFCLDRLYEVRGDVLWGSIADDSTHCNNFGKVALKTQ